MKKFAYGLYRFSSSWTGTIIIVLLLIFFVAQSFVIPSGSMKRTLLIGDFLFAKKFAYGVTIPELPWVGLKLLPDFRGDGHLIDGPRPRREDIVIFYVPKDRKTHFVKRCVAWGATRSSTTTSIFSFTSTKETTTSTNTTPPTRSFRPWTSSGWSIPT